MHTPSRLPAELGSFCYPRTPGTFSAYREWVRANISRMLSEHGSCAGSLEIVISCGRPRAWRGRKHRALQEGTEMSKSHGQEVPGLCSEHAHLATVDGLPAQLCKVIHHIRAPRTLRIPSLQLSPCWWPAACPGPEQCLRVLPPRLWLG